MKFLTEIWNKISGAGVYRGLDAGMQNKIVLTNVISFCGCIFSLCVGFVYVRVPAIFIVFIISFLIYTSSFLFNYYHKYGASRFVLVALTPLYNMLVAGLTTSDTNVSSRFTFIIIIFFPVLVYQLSERKKMFAGMAWIFFLYIITDTVNAWIPRLPDIKADSEFDNPGLAFFRGLLTMALMAWGLYFIMNMHYKTQQKLASSLVNTKLLNKTAQQKSNELEAANHLLRQQQKEIGEMNHVLQSQLLKARLDPHFMYNALNSIQYFIMQNESQEALNYLSKFSRLMRQVLENSVSETVCIADELKALGFYLDLERMRFANSFDYTIFTDEEIDIQNTEIPSMLLQPYIENAIVHGMRGKEKGGMIKLSILLQGQDILCVVEDNGSGYIKAENNNKGSGHISRATEANINRLALLKSGAGIYTLELKDENGNVCGTRVEIKIPVSM